MENKVYNNEMINELIVWFKTANPKDVLHVVYGYPTDLPGGLLLLHNLKDLGLKNELINVLLHYVTLSCNGDLPHRYSVLLGKHWLDNGITTVEEAMEFVQKENNKLKEIVLSNLDSIGTIFQNIGMLVSINTSERELGKAVKELYDRKLIRC